MTGPPGSSSLRSAKELSADIFVYGALALLTFAGIALTSPGLGQKIMSLDVVTRGDVPRVVDMPSGHPPVSPTRQPYPIMGPPRVAMAAASSQNSVRTIDPGTADLTTLRSDPGFITLFGDPMRDAFFERSTHKNTTSFYGGDWMADNVVQSAQGAQLFIRRGPNDTFTMGEMRTLALYGFGRYEVVMRAARGDGSVSAFFTYTGPHESNPHDEIDIEFLGKDTTKLHLNYWRNGRTGDHIILDLPFDAAEGLYHYAFEWTPGRLRWFVEGELVHETAPGDRFIPATPARVFASVWTGKPDRRAWHGAPTFGRESAMDLACASFTPVGATGRACSDFYLSANPFRAAR